MFTAAAKQSQKRPAHNRNLKNPALSEPALKIVKEKGLQKKSLKETLRKAGPQPPKVKPILKWVGGKRQLLPELSKRMPESFGTYYEPFIGGGALFFNGEFKTAILGDVNAELINTYSIVRNRVEALIEKLGEHRYEKEYYYKIRALDPANLTKVERAARFIYLNKTCFNGLYRVNSKGKFNVPFGSHKNPLICDAENLRAVGRRLKQTRLECLDYASLVQDARSGDFVYFDPPYDPVSTTSHFVSYARDGFDRRNQKELADLFDELTRRGVHCMLSNSSTPLIHELYSRHRLETVQAKRNVNAKVKGRGAVAEVIVRNY